MTVKEEEQREAPPVEPEPLIESPKTFTTDRETSDGFTYQARLTVGGVLDGESAADRGFVATSCQFNEQRDAVVPWTAVVRNTTASFDLELNLGIAWGDPEGAREYSVGMESDRDYGCGEPDGGVPGNVACCNLVNPSELAPRETTSASGGFIFHDFYGPREPAGETSLLSQMSRGLMRRRDANTGRTCDETSGARI